MIAPLFSETLGYKLGSSVKSKLVPKLLNCTVRNRYFHSSKHEKKAYEAHKQKYLKLQEQLKNEQDKIHDSTRECYRLIQSSDRVSLKAFYICIAGEQVIFRRLSACSVILNFIF